MTDTLIELAGVEKRFGELQAVAGVDLAVARGELFGLIGHNGAGKTTLFRMMLGLLRPSAGAIRIDGEDVAGPAFRSVRRRIGYLPESLNFYDNLSGLETLRFFARLKGADERSAPALLERVGLADAAGQRLRGYSKGMRQRLGFAQALLGSPQLLFLDEPTNGLDPQGIRDFYAALSELREGGVTVVLTSHILAEIEQRVDRLALMQGGRIRALGSVRELRAARKLPLTVRVFLRAGGEPALRAVLAGHGVDELDVHDGIARIDCERDAKMALLSVLAGLGAAVADVEVREPSLEDVFLGYAEASS